MNAAKQKFFGVSFWVHFFSLGYQETSVSEILIVFFCLCVLKGASYFLRGKRSLLHEIAQLLLAVVRIFT